MNMGGNGHNKILRFERPPQRVVSLVPSITESLFDLGLGAAVVGITDYCIHPAQELADLPRLGGPRDPRLEDILALKPDLVLANWEENSRGTVEALEAEGVPVWVSFPRSVQGAIETLWGLVGIFHSQPASLRLQTLELTLDWATEAASARPSLRCFCPIWRGQLPDGTRWWMTFNQGTYCHDLLRLVGCQNVFAQRERRYPLEADLRLAEAQSAGERDTRYPCVTLDEIRAAQPEVILLPNDPFTFDEKHRQELLDLLVDTPAARKGRVLLVDGSLVTWPGTRLARALRELPALLEEAGG